MEAGAAGAGVAADNISPTASVSRREFAVSRQYQHLLDKTAPYVLYRWIACFVVAFIYIVRVSSVQGFYFVSYCLGLYILKSLKSLMRFLSAQISDGATLPTRASDEFLPFDRWVPEFKFWYSITKAFCIAFVMTFFSVLDVPMNWRLLLFLWVVLFTLIMWRHKSLMFKHR